MYPFRVNEMLSSGVIEKIFSYSEGETAKNMTGSQASLDNSVFIITMTQI